MAVEAVGSKRALEKSLPSEHEQASVSGARLVCLNYYGCEQVPDSGCFALQFPPATAEEDKSVSDYSMPYGLEELPLSVDDDVRMQDRSILGPSVPKTKDCVFADDEERAISEVRGNGFPRAAPANASLPVSAFHQKQGVDRHTHSGMRLHSRKRPHGVNPDRIAPTREASDGRERWAAEEKPARRDSKRQHCGRGESCRTDLTGDLMRHRERPNQCGPHGAETGASESVQFGLSRDARAPACGHPRNELRQVAIQGSDVPSISCTRFGGGRHVAGTNDDKWRGPARLTSSSHMGISPASAFEPAVDHAHSRGTLISSDEATWQTVDAYQRASDTELWYPTRKMCAGIDFTSKLPAAESGHGIEGQYNERGQYGVEMGERSQEGQRYVKVKSHVSMTDARDVGKRQDPRFAWPQAPRGPGDDVGGGGFFDESEALLRTPYLQALVQESVASDQPDPGRWRLPDMDAGTVLDSRPLDMQARKDGALLHEYLMPDACSVAPSRRVCGHDYATSIRNFENVHSREDPFRKSKSSTGRGAARMGSRSGVPSEGSSPQLYARQLTLPERSDQPTQEAGRNPHGRGFGKWARSIRRRCSPAKGSGAGHVKSDGCGSGRRQPIDAEW